MELKDWRNLYRKNELAELQALKGLAKMLPINRAGPQAGAVNHLLQELDGYEAAWQKQQHSLFKTMKKMGQEVAVFH
jgi:hypothetical protein